jgi:HPt (histidine-containing phosphotransfer) domain-containing protein
MIDRKIFDDFVEQYDKEFFVNEIIDYFFTIFESRIEIIRQHVADRNFADLEKTAHSIKSASCNFWDPVSLKYANELEQQAKREETDGLDEAFQKFEESMKSLVAELRVIREELIS